MELNIKMNKAIIITIIIIIIGLSGSVNAWYNTDYPYRMQINISDKYDDVTNYQVHPIIDMSTEFSAGHIDETCLGTTFVNSADDGELKFWIESCNFTTNDNMSTWVNVTIVNNTNTTVYFYYGNGSATVNSDGDATFEFFDDFRFDGATVYPWETKSNLTYQVADFPCVNYTDGKIRCFGGYDENKATVGYTQIYDTSTDSVTLGDPITARWGAAAAKYKDSVIIYGGNGGSPTYRVVEKYNITTNTTSRLNDLPANITDQGLEAVEVGERLFVFYKNWTYEHIMPSDTYILRNWTNPSVVTWATVAFVNVSGDERIYRMGGSPTTNENYYFKVADYGWSSAQAVTPYGAFGGNRDGAIYDGKIVYTHGLGTAFHKEFYLYDPTDAWSGRYLEGRHGRDGIGGAVNVNDIIYVLGGRQVAPGLGLGYIESFDPALNGSASDINATKWTEDAVNYIQYELTNQTDSYFRFAAAEASWIANNGNTGSQHQATWTPLNSFIVDYTSKLGDKDVIWYMGVGGIALVGSDDKISAIIAHSDEIATSVTPEIGPIFVESSTASDISVSHEDERNFRYVVNGTSVEILQKATSAAEYSSVLNGTSADIAKLALVAGRYLTQPYLDYVDISNLFVRKYANESLIVLYYGAEESGVTCNCSTCDECETKLNAASCSVVQLNTSITNYNGACINNPENISNKIFDCQGHTIDGTDAWEVDYAIIMYAKENVTIKNCPITDMNQAIVGSIYAHNITIHNCSSSSATNDGFAFYYSTAINISGGFGTTTTNDCVYLFHVNDSTVEDYSASSCGKGIWLRGGSINNTVRNCTSTTSTESGIVLTETTNSRIINNTANSNTQRGILVETSSSNNNISNNVANNNQLDGLRFTSNSINNIVNNNSFCDNNQNGGAYYDISDADANSGDENTCDTTYNWNDAGTTGCTYPCVVGVNCGDIITSNTTLQTDLICTGNGLSWGANGVFLNCSHYNISGDGTGTGLLITNSNDSGIQECYMPSNFATNINVSSSNNTLLNFSETTGEMSWTQCNNSNYITKIRLQLSYWRCIWKVTGLHTTILDSSICLFTTEDYSDTCKKAYTEAAPWAPDWLKLAAYGYIPAGALYAIYMRRRKIRNYIRRRFGR